MSTRKGSTQMDGAYAEQQLRWDLVSILKSVLHGLSAQIGGKQMAADSVVWMNRYGPMTGAEFSL